MLMIFTGQVESITLATVASACAAKVDTVTTFTVKAATVSPFTGAATPAMLASTASIDSVPFVTVAHPFVADSGGTVLSYVALANIKGSSSLVASLLTRIHHMSTSLSCSSFLWTTRCTLRSCARDRNCRRTREEAQ